MQFRIEKGIKIPERDRTKSGAFSKYPFEKMKKGNSFFIKNCNLRQRNNLASSAKSFVTTHKLKWKFITRKVKKGIRIWRIK